uniref:Large ribosomal subunit protein mL62 n=1 Tax=Ciona savignyi TaxID=51511 RepID=H2ZPN0_CIOSA
MHSCFRKMTSLLRNIFLSSNLCSRCLARNIAYKSIYHAVNLYPDSVGSFSSFQNDKSVDSEKFQGPVLKKNVKVEYTKSSKPGGQHVNTTLSKAIIRFHLMTAEWIPKPVREVMAEKYKNRLTRSGDLIVWNEDSRYQMRNLQSCLAKVEEMILEAQKPPDTSKEQRIADLFNMDSIYAAHKKRLQKKKKNSFTKSMRNVGNFEE